MSADARDVRLARRAVHEPLGISAPTVADALLAGLTREACDARLGAWGRTLLAQAEATLTVAGREHVAPGTADVVMSNHQSQYDVPVLYASFPGTLRMVAKTEPLRDPLFGSARDRLIADVRGSIEAWTVRSADAPRGARATALESPGAPPRPRGAQRRRCYLIGFHPSRSPLVAALVAAAACTALAISAQAQTPARQPARRGSTPAAPARAATSDAPGAFREPTSMAGADVGAGRANATSEGPVGELRGPGGPTPDMVTGPIGPGDAARLIRAQMPQLRPCYERARATNPTLAGRVEVRFTINREGRVTQASAAGLPSAPEVAPCVADVMRRTTFPQPENGSLQLFYPITFAPDPVIPQPRRRGSGPARPTGAASARTGGARTNAGAAPRAGASTAVAAQGPGSR